MILLLNPISTPITLSLLSIKGKTIYQQKWLSNQNLNHEIIPEISKLFKKAKIQKFHLTKIICLIGPGSYTNLRLFLSTVNMFGYLLKIPLYGFSLYDLELFSFLSSFPQVREKLQVNICLKSAYSELMRCFLITKYANKQVVSLLKKTKQYKNSTDLPLNYSAGFLTVNQRISDFPAIDLCLVEQSENFAKKVIIEKPTIDFKHLKKSKILLPVYYAPAVITNRKSKLT